MQELACKGNEEVANVYVEKGRKKRKKKGKEKKRSKVKI
jgi:hypothetical protein